MNVSLAKGLAYAGIALIAILIVIASATPHIKFNLM